MPSAPAGSSHRRAHDRQRRDMIALSAHDTNAVEHYRAAARLGITTVRDASGDLPYQVLAWRSEIADGKLFGPTLLSSGPKIEGVKPMWKGTI